MKKIYFIIFLVIILNIFLPFQNILAMTVINPGFDVIEKPLGMSTKDVRIVIADLINQATGLLGIVSVIIILYGGLIWMISWGDEEKVQKAKQTLTSGIIGLIIILTSYSLSSYILTTVLNATT